MPNYSCLNQQVFSKGEFKLVPIRFEDRYEIMKWRNEQIYLLRQNELLSDEQQDEYFINIVMKLFRQKKPNQVLFSFLYNSQLIGYGGLVHINWWSKHAEISILLSIGNNFEKYLQQSTIFYSLIEEVAMDLKMNKIYTYGYDFSDLRFEPLYRSGFHLDAFLHEHACVNNKLVPVRIYSKLLKL